MPRAAPREESDLREGQVVEGPLVAFRAYGPEAFAEAKRERRFVLLDGAAEWCHWCHVMDEVTYRNREVAAVLKKHFVAIKVDVDEHPDIAERYKDYGFPATVLFDPDAEELGKYKGFLEPDALLAILHEVVRSGGSGSRPGEVHEPPGRDLAPSEWRARHESIRTRLEAYYDPRQGGWGLQQKAPLASNNQWLLSLAAKGEKQARDRILFTLLAQDGVTDPVWGGVYQYSVDGVWTSPHYEKLTTVNAGALQNYAAAFLLTRDPLWLTRAARVAAFMRRFMRLPSGAFAATQDADLKTTHGPFVSGHAYYQKNEPARLQLGLPRVDARPFPRENGMMMLGLSWLAKAHETHHQPERASETRREAEGIFRAITNELSGRTGMLRHTASSESAVLADQAWFALGLLALESEAARTEARKLLSATVEHLWDESKGGFYARSLDPEAAGVFARRRIPGEDNAIMARALLLAFPESSGEGSDLQRRRARRALERATRSVDREGRLLGEYLLGIALLFESSR